MSKRDRKRALVRPPRTKKKEIQYSLSSFFKGFVFLELICVCVII